MGRLFGTDGVRGVANADLTPDLALRLGRAAAGILAPNTGNGDRRARVIIGRDPRRSGPMLESALAAGLASAGADVDLVGVVPTPAVAYLTGLLRADFGGMISASHNPMEDNGIKFFAGGGRKLPDRIEDEIEARLADEVPGPTGRDVGVIAERRDASGAYLDHLLASAPTRLSGLRLVVDCANGAASVVGPDAYRIAGAEVITINCDPDGCNINVDCGSTHMDQLMEAVVDVGADLGIAHDGDADRCLAVDAQGNLVDGDQMMAILAVAMRDQGTLAKNTVVATVMSNLGFKQAMARERINVVETQVGDRYVLEALTEGGFNLGGEQSGHVILGDYATTGDGVLTALTVMGRMASTGRTLADLASVMEVLPQVLINVRGVDRNGLDGCPSVREAVAAAEARLADDGRVLLRASGTEPVVRVMVEATTPELAREVATTVADVVHAELAE